MILMMPLTGFAQPIGGERVGIALPDALGQSLARPDLLLGFQDKSCPTCLPSEPATDTPRLGLAKRPELGIDAGIFERCRRVARVLRQEVPQNKDCFVGGRCLDESSKRAAEQYEQFLVNCMVPVNEVDPSASSITAELRSFAVLTTRDGAVPLCSALILDVRTAVTVAHCLQGENASGLVLRSFQRPLEPISFAIDSGAIPMWAQNVDDPPVFLTLQNGAGDNDLSVCLDDPASGNPVSVFGYLPDTLLPQEPTDWTTSLKTGLFECTALSSVESSARSFEHNCQAYPRFSGAPIFAAPMAGSTCSVRVVGLQRAGGSGPNSNSAFAGSGLRR
jgi:hypothetical protein